VRGAPWKDILTASRRPSADGIELNFGCPHGMSERGMGAAVGQVPEYVEMVARWCKQHTRMPVIVKLTPNITDVRKPARAAKKGGADAVVADQHHQLDHRHRPRRLRADADRGRRRAPMAAIAARR
jgi:dihydroorotate dehydrogenase